MEVGRRLADRAKQSPGATALVGSRGSLDYAGWNARANLLATDLRREGVGSGDAVAMMLPNGLAFALAYAALAKLGAIAMPVDERLPDAELGRVVERGRSRVSLAGDAKAAGRVEAAGGRAIVLGEPDLEAQPEAAPEVSAQPAPAAPALYLHTSGTTGRVRVVELSRAHLDCFPAAMAEGVGTSARDVALMALPMSHISGPVVLNETIDKGSALVIVDPITPPALLAAITRHRVTWMHSVPPIYQAMLRALRPEHDLASLRMVAMMGTSVPVPTLRALKQACPNAAVIQGYGLTETAPLLTLLPLADDERKLGSVGRAVPGAELRIVGDDGRELPPGAAGELVVRGPMVMTGYVGDAEATRERIRDGWLHTGDVMLADDDGYLFHLGRRDDLIVTRHGLNLYPAEVENALLGHPGVEDVAVAGVSGRTGLEITAWVVRAPGATVSEGELRRFCAERIARFKVPREIAFVDTIPRNAMNKVLRGELEAAG